MKKRRNVYQRAVALLMIFVTLAVSCRPDLAGPAPLSDSELGRRSVTLLEAALDENVMNALRAENDAALNEFLRSPDLAEETVTRALGEDGGREYLEFLVAAGEFDANSGLYTAEDVFRAAEGKCPDEDLEDARRQIAELEERMGDVFEEASRSMTESQQRALYRDLRKLVVKGAVLLTAAIVYACVPELMFWGKVSAASACAVAAGVLAATITSLVEYSKIGAPQTTFSEWMEDVAKEPTAAWAIASGLISTNMAMGHSPVITAIVIGVFAIYGVVDDVKPLLKKYSSAR